MLVINYQLQIKFTLTWRKTNYFSPPNNGCCLLEIRLVCLATVSFPMQFMNISSDLSKYVGIQIYKYMYTHERYTLNGLPGCLHVEPAEENILAYSR